MGYSNSVLRTAARGSLNASRTTFIRHVPACFSLAEDAMKKVEMKVYKELLLKLRARLRGDVSAMADAALRKTRSESSGDLSSMPIHMADMGTDAFEQEFTLRLMEHDGATLGQIEGALERIEGGDYGVWTECEPRIPKTRLNVLPYTPYCIKCADKVHTH